MALIRFVHATKGAKFFQPAVARQKDLLAKRGWYPDPIPHKEVKIAAKKEAPKEAPEEYDVQALKAEYKKLYDKKPYHKWDGATLTEKINAKK